MPRRRLYTSVRLTGSIIEPVGSVDEGKSLIERYEKWDRWAGSYEDRHYDIVDERHNSVLKEGLYAFD